MIEPNTLMTIGDFAGSSDSGGRLAVITQSPSERETAVTLCKAEICENVTLDNGDIEPRLEDHTIWTAVAPEDILTVRTYATNQHSTGPA